MSPKSAPVGQRPIPGSASQHPGKNPLTSLARNRLAASDTSVPSLVGEQKETIESLLARAQTSDAETAKRLYTQIIESEDNYKDVHPILFARCFAQRAALFPEGSSERNTNAQYALARWHNIYRKKIRGDELLQHYEYLLICCDKLCSLLPTHRTLLEAHRVTYGNHHTLWLNFSPLVAKADELKDTAQATAVYLQALDLIKDQNEAFYQLHKANCFLKLARLHEREANVYDSDAKKLIFDLVDQRDPIDLSHLDRLFDELESIYRADPDTTEEIKRNREILNKKLHPKETAPSEERREVSKGWDNRGLMRLFLLIVAGALIGTAVMLYRRNVVKL